MCLMKDKQRREAIWEIFFTIAILQKSISTKASGDSTKANFNKSQSRQRNSSNQNMFQKPKFYRRETTQPSLTNRAPQRGNRISGLDELETSFARKISNNCKVSHELSTRSNSHTITISDRNTPAESPKLDNSSIYIYIYIQYVIVFLFWTQTEDNYPSWKKTTRQVRHRYHKLTPQSEKMTSKLIEQQHWWWYIDHTPSPPR